jgi:hypothetical protein
MEDQGSLNIRVRWRLVKWEGEPPKEGEQKEPLEVIEGGDDIQTRVIKSKDATDERR